MKNPALVCLIASLFIFVLGINSLIKQKPTTDSIIKSNESRSRMINYRLDTLEYNQGYIQDDLEMLRDFGATDRDVQNLIQLNKVFYQELMKIKKELNQ